MGIKTYGNWIYDANGNPHCSECGMEPRENGISPYCPECGANMEPDLEEEKNPNINQQEALEYIRSHFSCSGEAMRLIDNILAFVAIQGCDTEEKTRLLHALLDGAIGLTSDEIGQIAI